MAAEFDFLSPSDRPALVGLQTGDLIEKGRTLLACLGYKVHVAATPEEFLARFATSPYQVVLIEETFGGGTENVALSTLQTMPMNQRRHATIFLIGGSYETLNALQAFQQSVHATIHYREVGLLDVLLPKVVADNDAFHGAFREVQERVLRGRS